MVLPSDEESKNVDRDISERDLISRHEDLHFIDSPTIHIGSVRAPTVGDHVATVRAFELCLNARDVPVVQNQVAFPAPADCRHAFLQGEVVTLPARRLCSQFLVHGTFGL